MAARTIPRRRAASGYTTVARARLPGRLQDFDCGDDRSALAGGEIQVECAVIDSHFGLLHHGRSDARLGRQVEGIEQIVAFGRDRQNCS